MTVNNIELAIGQRWKTRSGQEVEVIDNDGDKSYPWDLSNETCVTDYGHVWEHKENDDDLITLLQDEHGFTPWNGGVRPIEYGVEIEYKMKNDPTKVFEGFSDGLRWEHISSGGDIIAYRVVKQEAELTETEAMEEPKYTVEQVFKAINEATDDLVMYTNVGKVKAHLNTQDPDYKLYLELKAKYE